LKEGRDQTKKRASDRTRFEKKEGNEKKARFR
jgi:hypothetical protein